MRSFHVEQDAKWETDYTEGVTQHNRVLLSTWTVYEYVGRPAYQTPVFHANNETEARQFVADQLTKEGD